MTKSKPVRKVCGHCGSENVSQDALARWDVDSQQWEISSNLDNSDCDRCGDECTIEDAPINYDPWAYARDVDRVRVIPKPGGTGFQVLHYPEGTTDSVVVAEGATAEIADQAAHEFSKDFDDCLVQQTEDEDYP